MYHGKVERHVSNEISANALAVGVHDGDSYSGDDMAIKRYPTLRRTDSETINIAACKTAIEVQKMRSLPRSITYPATSPVAMAISMTKRHRIAGYPVPNIAQMHASATVA